ncbi:MAG TPA: FAD-dependent oxidoreductase [Dehalococcoidia bacterium]
MQRPEPVDFLLVGGGLASATAAETLRRHGARGRIAVVGAEPELPYNRPPLSKDFLRGETPKEEIAVQPAAFYRDQDIELLTGHTVEAVDPEARTVRLHTGEVLPYRRLLLATGASLRLLPVPGAELGEVFYLRTVADSQRIQAAARAHRTAVVVGGGFIGAEVAASLTQMGLRVTIVELQSILWAHLFGDEMGRYFHQALADRGVTIVTEDEVAGLESQDGTVSTGERVSAVITKKGKVLPAEMVVIGIGVDPETSLAIDAGLQVDRGVLVDEHMRTSRPDVYAAGDCINFYHPLYNQRLHVEHWQNAIDTGEVAALNMLGQETPIRRAPYFYSDLFDVGMEYLGHAPQWEDLILRGRPEEGSFGAYYVHEGRIVAALHVNNFDETDAARALVEAKVPAAGIAGRLADRSVPLASLAPAAS